MENIGSIVKNRREVLNLTREDLSKISQVGVRTIYAIEQGVGNPSINTLRKVLEALGLEMIIQIRKL